MSSFIPRNLTEMDTVAGRTFACMCHTAIYMFSCLKIDCRPFYLWQLLKFHPFDWLIEIYLQNNGQGTHHKVLSLQAMPSFPLCYRELGVQNFLASQVTILSLTGIYYNSGWNGTPNDLSSSEQINYRK